MGDSSDINQLKDAEFKEAFDEFDTVSFDLHFTLRADDDDETVSID